MLLPSKEAGTYVRNAGSGYAQDKRENTEYERIDTFPTQGCADAANFRIAIAVARIIYRRKPKMTGSL